MESRNGGHFDYRDLQLIKTRISGKDSAMLSCTVKNSGDREGDEVVELYIRELVSSVARPVIALKEFERIHLRAGESKAVSFVISPAVLEALDKDLKMGVESGDYQLMIGGSSRDLRQKEVLTVF